MGYRFCFSLIPATALLLLLGVPQTRGQAPKPVKKWTALRTPDGHPDLQGFWTNSTVTPLERPAELANKEFFTEQEAAAFEKERIERENAQAKTDIHYDNVLWQSEKHSKAVSNLL